MSFLPSTLTSSVILSSPSKQVPVPDRCLGLLMSALSAASLRALEPKAVAEAAWALGVLQYHPDAEWWRQYETVLLESTAVPSPLSGQTFGGSHEADSQRGGVCKGRMIDAMPGRQLCEVAWACALLRLSPSRPMLASLAAASARQLPALGPSSLSNLLWSMTVLDPSGEAFEESPSFAPPTFPGGSSAGHTLAHDVSTASSPRGSSFSQRRGSRGKAAPGGLLSHADSGAATVPSLAPSWRAWMDLWLTEASVKMSGFEPQVSGRCFKHPFVTSPHVRSGLEGVLIVV